SRIAEDNVRGSTVQPEDADFWMGVARHLEAFLALLTTVGYSCQPAEIPENRSDSVATNQCGGRPSVDHLSPPRSLPPQEKQDSPVGLLTMAFILLDEWQGMVLI